MVWITTTIFGSLVVIGGVIGYAKARSALSLVAGIVCGGALLYAAYLIRWAEHAGIMIAMVVSILLALIFFNRWSKTKKFMPAGLLLILSVIELALLFLGG